MAAVGGGLVLVLALGFRLHDQRVPEGLVEAFFPALGLVVLAGVAFAARPPAFARRPRRLFSSRARRGALARDHGQDRATRLEARRLRLADLSADPATAKYVPRIEAGEAWSDAQIDYDLDPDRLATCRHLQPVERALRRSGVTVRLRRGPEVDADCRVDQAGFEATWRPPSTVVYSEVEGGGRAYEDPPHAFFACTTCWSWIHVRHPLEATVATPWFPAPPAEAADLAAG